MLLALCGCLACSTSVRAERTLLAPRSDAPLSLIAGGTLSVSVDVATGLTPPPGIQEDRALRLFSLTLCADGIDLGGGARRCFPLAVRNVRPADGASLRYRVEAPLPVWVAPWLYDLDVRFPGGQASAQRAVRVLPAPGSVPFALPLAGQPFELAPALTRSAQGVAWLPAGDGTGLVRVHVGAAGLALSGARFAGFPLPDSVRGFAPGFVALVQAGPTPPVWMTKRHGSVSFPLVMEPAEAQAGRPVRLTAHNLPPGAQLFWWLDPARGALGSDVTSVFLQRGQVPLELLAVAPDGRFARARAVLPIWQRRAFGCSAAAVGSPPGSPPGPANWLILLGIWLCLARRSRVGARFAIAATRERRQGAARERGPRAAASRSARVRARAKR